MAFAADSFMWQKRARYCPLCSVELEARLVGGRERKACPGCRFVLFVGPAGAAAGVVLDEARRVLLVRRGIEPYRGDWALPAGYQEIEEHPREALVREVREETGIDIDVGELLELLFIPDDPRKPANVAIYRCRPSRPGQVPQAGDDARDARWFALDDLPEDLGFPNNRVILEAIRLEDPYPG